MRTHRQANGRFLSVSCRSCYEDAVTTKPVVAEVAVDPLEDEDSKVAAPLAVLREATRESTEQRRALCTPPASSLSSAGWLFARRRPVPSRRRQVRARRRARHRGNHRAPTGKGRTIPVRRRTGPTSNFSASCACSSGRSSTHEQQAATPTQIACNMQQRASGAPWACTQAASPKQRISGSGK
jgi:hypothetical protein